MALKDRIPLTTLNLIQRRPRLNDLLTEFVEAKKRLITIYAPAGYGKSTLLMSFVQETSLPVFWYSLEQPDRDPRRFLRRLAQDISICYQKETAAADDERRIINLLTDVGPHLIIIDNYHKAVSARFILSLNRLLEQLPPDSILIIAARGDLLLDTQVIIDLILAGLSVGLSEEELRFTPAETQQVINKRLYRQITRDVAEEITQATNGNIARILLYGHTISGQFGNVPYLGENLDVIYSYLAAEVLDKQPPELRRFLLHTSILPDLTPKICNELLEIDNAQARLDELIQKDLFITQIEEKFEYHEVFVEFLRSRLAEDETLYHQVSVRAGDILVAQSRLEDAINLYLSVQNWDKMIALLETYGRRLYEAGQALLLYDWLTNIPEAELNKHLRLMLLWGRILNDDLGELDQAISVFQQVEQQFLRDDDLIGAAEARIWQSVSLRTMGQANKAVEAASEGLEQLKALGADEVTIAWATRNYGVAFRTAGKISEALLHLNQALEVFDKSGSNEYYVGLCHYDIGVYLMTQSNVSGAQHHYRHAMTIWKYLGNERNLAMTLNALGVSMYLAGRYDEALEYCTQSYLLANHLGINIHAAYAKATIGDVYLTRKEYDKAIEAYEQSVQLLKETDVLSLRMYNRVKMGECSYQKNELSKALALANEVRQITGEAGLDFENGLACALQAIVYIRQLMYPQAGELLSEAQSLLPKSGTLEQIKVSLWWGYCLLLDSRRVAASEKLQEAVEMIRQNKDILVELKQTIGETQQLFLHFLHSKNTLTELKNHLHWLFQQNHPVENSKNIQVFSFGTPVAIIVDDKYNNLSSKLRRSNAAELLLYLIIEKPDTHLRWNEISAAIWPDASPAIRKTINRLATRLSHILGIDLIQGDLYQFDSSCLVWCDALAFETLLKRAASAPPEQALELHLEIIDLYRSEFLRGFELGDWGTFKRAWYEIQFFEIATSAGRQLLKNGDFERARAIADKALLFDDSHPDLQNIAQEARDALNK